MRELPIHFNGPMVRAILEGRKTQTRRIVKPQHFREDHGEDASGQCISAGWYPDLRLCPYGQPGNRLWVREAWQVARETLDYETGGEYDVWEWNDDMGDPRQYLKGDARFGTKAGLFYAADGEDKNPGAFYNLTGLDNKTILRTKEINWRPSIHMPHWASRITLEVTGVRVERVQDISEADALAEGVFSKVGSTPIGDEVVTATGGELIYASSTQAREEYRRLWGQINGPDSWSDNPWVWVVEFKRVTEATEP